MKKKRAYLVELQLKIPVYQQVIAEVIKAKYDLNVAAKLKFGKSPVGVGILMQVAIPNFPKEVYYYRQITPWMFKSINFDDLIKLEVEHAAHQLGDKLQQEKMKNGVRV